MTEKNVKNHVSMCFVQVWVNAAAQNFNSIGIAFGSMVAFSSYNKRENKIFRYVNTLISSCMRGG